MKKVLLLILAVTLSLIPLSACTKHDDVKGAFFSESYLSQMSLDSLPVPKLDGAMLRDGEILYLNLTSAEYTSYAKEIADYLLESDGIYDPCYKVSQNNLMLIPLDYICSPIDASYKPDDENISIFFSTSADLDTETGKMIAPMRINLIRETAKIGGKEYNCKMTIDPDVVLNVIIDQCYFGHTYGDDYEEIIVPATNAPSTIKKYTCIYCNSETYTDFIGDYNLYPITVSKGADYITKRISDEGVSGAYYEIITSKYMDADITVTVNGIKIPKSEGDDGETWYFAFIMPCESVDIKVTLNDGFFYYEELSEYEPWLADIDADSVCAIKTTVEYIGTPPGTEKIVKTSTDREVIKDFIESLSNTTMLSITKEDSQIDGGSALTIDITFEDGAEKSLTFSNNIYVHTNEDSSEAYFMIKALPRLPK